MSGETDQTDGTQDAETEAEDAGSTEEPSPEAEAEAEAVREEFTGSKLEDDDNSETGDKARAGPGPSGRPGRNAPRRNA